MMSLSRGAILATLIGFGTILIMTRRVRLRSVLFFATILIITKLVPFASRFVANTINLKDPSSFYHVQQLDLGWRFLFLHPWGLGLGHGGYVEGQYSSDMSEGLGESFYFSMVSQVGIIGLGLFILSLLTLFINLYQCYKRQQSELSKVTALVSLSALVGYSIAAIASESAFGMLASAAVWFMVGMVIQMGARVNLARPRSAD